MAFVRNLDNLDARINLDEGRIAEFIRQLEEFPEKFRKSAEKAVLSAGAKPILKAARAKVPVRSKGGGTLKKSLGVKVYIGKKSSAAYVGPRSGFAYEKNVTGRRRDKGKGKKIDAQEVAFYQETGTPRHAAQPFIRPAIDSAQSSVLSAMAAEIDRQLTKIISKTVIRG